MFLKWEGESRWQTFPLGQIVAVVMPIVCVATAACLFKGRRNHARYCWGLGFLLLAILQVVQTVLMGCTCAWVYKDTHADPIRNYDWTLTVSSILNVIICLLACAVATHPKWTFYLVFVAAPICFLFESAFRLVHWKRFHTMSPFNQAFSAGVSSIGFFLWRRRCRALKTAEELRKKDAQRYNEKWEELDAQPGFKDGLTKLADAWENAMETAERLKEIEQRGASTVGELFEHADSLNDPLQAKFHSLLSELKAKSGNLQEGTEHHPCDVKQEARALQKVHRSYGENWRRLTDLCRTSLVFPSLSAMAECLGAIAADSEIKVVRVNNNKMRFRRDYDATLTGGYRDVQLTIKLESPEAKARGKGAVCRHLAEVQLHLDEFYSLKQAGGHRVYVERRNMTGG